MKRLTQVIPEQRNGGPQIVVEIELLKRRALGVLNLGDVFHRRNTDDRKDRQRQHQLDQRKALAVQPHGVAPGTPGSAKGKS